MKRELDRSLASMLTQAWPVPSQLEAALRNSSQARISGSLVTAAAPLLAAEALARGVRIVMMIVPGAQKLRAAARQVRSWLEIAGLGGVPVTHLPDIPGTPWDILPLHSHIQIERAEAAARLYGEGSAVIVAPAGALRWGLPKRNLFAELSLEIKPGLELSMDDLAKRLVEQGYVRRQLVSEPGEFALRGYIADVFSPDHGLPARVEYFGDHVESVRSFNPGTQRSMGTLNNYCAIPLRCVLFDQENLAALRARTVSDSSLDASEREERLQQLTQGEEAPWFWKEEASARMLEKFGKALPKDAVVMFVEHDRIVSVCETQEEQWRNVSLERPGRISGFAAEMLGGGTPFDSFSGQQIVELRSLRVDDSPGADPENVSEEIDAGLVTPLPPEGAHEPFARFLAEVDQLDNDGRCALVLLRSEGHVQRLSEQLLERGNRALRIENPAAPAEDIINALEANKRGSVAITTGELSCGFLLEAAGLRVFTHEDIYGKAKAPRRTRSAAAAFSIPLHELDEGDYIVHEDHGVGRFAGLKTVRQNGEVRDFIQLSYRDGDRLLIPVDNMNRVQKFSAPEGVRPKLDKLGGASWQTVKNRARRAIREMAGELIGLYAARASIQGFSHVPDGEMMREFERSFQHQETPDQIRTMEEIKADMESNRPMDRLVCGDVGYGKTELAIRAAVKAALSGTQTAVLAPTTVLAQQHWETFKERLQGFPFSVEMISRFRSPGEQKKILRRLAEGSVDIIVGTHRLLSKDVQIKKLGLLVIDEEQRFGVAHKERIKQMRKRVDVLALTATPIPRTLNMSIAGIRDMSLIETPPRNRLAVQTRVLPFNEDTIRAAISMELGREGQVFYLRNRIEGIEEVSEMVRRLVPESRPTIAHARMSAHALEAVMDSFVHGNTNVLISTTIIENGLDIPNANTLIVERADRFGLAQLYQIRGRIGRSDRSAYAYLLAPPPAALNPDAQRRLQAIREFSELGSGFRIAAMDLEIRGAGNLLGGEQSGHIEAIGFDLYNRMLERAVREMKGVESEEAEFETQFNLGLDLHIPEEYIADTGTRMKYYRQLLEVDSEKDIEEAREEMADLFGPPPESILSLARFAATRLLASRMRIEKIDRYSSEVAIKFSPEAEIDSRALTQLAGSEGVRFTPGGVLFHPLSGTSPLDSLSDLYRLLQMLSG